MGADKQFNGTDGAESAETELYDALCFAGIVQPVRIDEPNGACAQLPSRLRDSANLLRALRDRQDMSAAERVDPAASTSSNETASTLFDQSSLTGPTTSGGRKVVFVSLVDLVRQAFFDIRQTSSVDRVIVDPDLNAQFIHRCWQLGAQASQYDLNWTLFHGRKNGILSGSPHSVRFTLRRERLDEFSFAAEIAARFVQREQMMGAQREVSLDRILCDTRLVGRFDEIARSLAPGYSAFEYRWAALALRKGRRRMAAVPRLTTNDFEDLGNTRHLSMYRVPSSGGLYRFVTDERILFIGQSSSLRRQVEIHFNCAGADLLPAWLDGNWGGGIRFQVAPMVGVGASRCAAAKVCQVAHLKPAFNWLFGKVA